MGWAIGLDKLISLCLKSNSPTCNKITLILSLYSCVNLSRSILPSKLIFFNSKCSFNILSYAYLNKNSCEHTISNPILNTYLSFSIILSYFYFVISIKSMWLSKDKSSSLIALLI